MPTRPFWFLLTWACILWYGSLVIYLGWKGLREIRQMISDIKKQSRE
jgi:hypothetical protein